MTPTQCGCFAFLPILLRTRDAVSFVCVCEMYSFLSFHAFAPDHIHRVHQNVRQYIKLQLTFIDEASYNGRSFVA